MLKHVIIVYSYFAGNHYYNITDLTDVYIECNYYRPSHHGDCKKY